MPQWSNASPRNKANIDPALTALAQKWDAYAAQARAVFSSTSDFDWTAEDAYPTTGADISSWLAHAHDVANDPTMEDGVKNLRPLGGPTYLG